MVPISCHYRRTFEQWCLARVCTNSAVCPHAAFISSQSTGCVGGVERGRGMGGGVSITVCFHGAFSSSQSTGCEVVCVCVC
jgi:hypothetical protein